jgi:outer membrane protein assembly factor BamB
MYESPTGTTAHECAHCGAPLPAPDAAGLRTCGFCKAVYQPPNPAAAPTTGPQINVIFDSRAVQDIDVAQPVATAAKGCGLASFVVLAIIIASIAVPIYFVAKSGAFDQLSSSISGVTTSSYRFGPNMAVLAGEPGAAPSLVVADSTYENSHTVRRLKRFDGGTGEARWTSPELPGDDAAVPLLTDANNVYVAVKAKVAAYKLTDGTAAWQGSLSDEYNGSSCAECFILVGTRLVVRTADGTLQAFDTAGGAPVWSQRLEDVNATIVRVGDVIVVRDGRGGDYTLTTLDPVTGTPIASFTPACVRPDGRYSSDLDSSSILRSSPAGDALIVGVGSSPWCLQGWDPHAGAMAWTVHADDSTYFRDDDFRLLDSPAGLVLTTGDTIGIVDPTRTSYRTILKAEQTEFRPIAATADVLYVEAVNSRGTTKAGVRALDLASGEQRFEFSTGKAKPIDGDRGVFASFHGSADGTFSAHVADGRISILTFTSGSGYDHTLATDSLDATTGAAGPHQTIKAESGSLIPDFGPVIWDGSKATARVGDDTIQVIDVGTGTVVSRIG